MWTQIWDMHSGGEQKLQWSKIFIEADTATARAYFEKRFDRRCDHITCDCCGEDYSVTWKGSEDTTLEDATQFHREDSKKTYPNGWVENPVRVYISVEEYLTRDDVLVIYAHEVKGFTVTERTQLEDIQHRLNLGDYDFTREDVVFLLHLLEKG